jgi:hypothetical protein
MQTGRFNKKELSSYFHDYYLKLKKLRSSKNDQLELYANLMPIRMTFLKGLKQTFGNDVYRCYQKITTPCCYPDRKKPNRITEGTTE